MGLVLEDGSGVAGANSYISEDTFDNYCEDRGITPASGDTEAAAIRASTAIDAEYGGSFPGYRVMGRNQGLEWPRLQAYDNQYWLIVGDEVPKEIVQATCEATIRELASPGSMMPDLVRGGNIKRKRIKVDAVETETEWAGNAEARTTFTLIRGILARILSGGSGGGLFGVAVRG